LAADRLIDRRLTFKAIVNPSAPWPSLEAYEDGAGIWS
jgi:hypothetical protein